MNEKKYVLMSIKPQYAEMIRQKKKSVELRKRIPKIKENDIIIFYESSPVKAVTLACEVSKIFCMPPEMLWKKCGKRAAVEHSFFQKYFEEKELAYGIELRNITTITPKGLHCISDELKAPQSYRYLTEAEFSKITMD